MRYPTADQWGAGTARVDSALAYGPSQLVAAIEEDLGIPFNHYVVLNFDSFGIVVNEFGGVAMYFPTGSTTTTRNSISRILIISMWMACSRLHSYPRDTYMHVLLLGR